MNTANNYQEQFNLLLQNNLPKHLSLVQAISEILEISQDSAYRRLRNETEYSIAEAVKIALNFEIPLESLNANISKAATFKINHLDHQIASYQSYLENMLAGVQQLTKIENAELFFAAEDIPVYYHFSQPNLRHFKICYWLKSLLNVPEFQHLNIEDISLPEKTIETAKTIFNKFQQLNSSEIWTEETVMSTLKQIKFYWDAGFFSKLETAIQALNELQLIIEAIRRNCDTGYKFDNGQMTSHKHTFYHSDLMIGNNAILVKAENFKISYISYSGFNFMQTANREFNDQNELWMNNIISKSTLISKVAEKQRNQFFRNIIRQISKLKLYMAESENELNEFNSF